MEDIDISFGLWSASVDGAMIFFEYRFYSGCRVQVLFVAYGTEWYTQVREMVYLSPGWSIGYFHPRHFLSAGGFRCRYPIILCEVL